MWRGQKFWQQESILPRQRAFKSATIAGLLSANGEGPLYDGIRQAPVNGFEEIDFKGLADVITREILDVGANRQCIIAGTPRGVGNEKPLLLLLAQTFFTGDRFAGRTEDCNQAQRERVVHWVREV